MPRWKKRRLVDGVQKGSGVAVIDSRPEWHEDKNKFHHESTKEKIAKSSGHSSSCLFRVFVLSCFRDGICSYLHAIRLPTPLFSPLFSRDNGPDHGDRALSPEPSQFPVREGPIMSENDTRAELFAALLALAKVVPEMRGGQLMAAVGELCADLHGRGLWDADDAELLEAVWQFRRTFQAATEGKQSGVVSLANGIGSGNDSRRL